MLCYNCGYIIPSEELKECPLCGMKFIIKCSACKHLNPKLARYCFNCGNKIETTGMKSSVQNFDVFRESRKNVAVMFADISGFTALSEKIDPEQVREIINDCFECITRPVYELEGTIDKYIGDCIMILFGAKHSHSDDPKRAVICAVKMLELIEEFSKERLMRRGLKLDLSIGINYGLVVTGSVGNYYDRDYTVMGDIVNTSQRLQSSAGKGNILVSESVYLDTKDNIEYSNVREITVKNKENPVKCYSPLYIIKETETDNTYLIERDYELHLLNKVYLEAQNTMCVNIIGESGLGKTSLVKSYLSGLDKKIKIISVECSSIFKSRVYYLISDIILNVLNLKGSDSGRVKENRLLSYIDYILDGFTEEERQKNFYFLSLVLGLERDNSFSIILNSMNHKDIESEIQNQLITFFSSMCKKHNFVFFIDSAQWADSASWTLLLQLIKALSDVKSMFILASRYEMEAIEQENAHVLHISKLSDAGVNELLCLLLNCQSVDKGLFDTALKFTNGNPLYIREFGVSIKGKITYTNNGGTAYADDNLLESIPKSIEGLILGSLENLEAGTIRFLQAASVVGEEFNALWILRMLDENVDEEEALKVLIQMDLISLSYVRTSSAGIEKICRFKQNMIRKVIYDSILNRTKEQLHKTLAEFIEINYSRELEQYYEVLSMHFKKARLDKRAGEYYYKTALKYKKDFIFSSSLEYYNKFMEDADIDDIGIIDALISIAYIHEKLSDFDTALEFLHKGLKSAVLSDDIYTIKIMTSEIYKEKGLYNDALSLLDEIQPKIRQNSSLYGKLLQLKCSIYSILGKQVALELAQKSEDILIKTGDYESLSETMRQAAYIYFINGDNDNALSYLNKAYNYAEKASNLGLIADISGNLGIIFHASGNISKALQFFNKSIDMSRKISNIKGIISGNTNLGILFMEKGLFGNAQILFEEGLRLSIKIESIYDNVVLSTNYGDLMYETGNVDKAFKYYNDSLDNSLKHTLSVEEAINYIGISKVYLEQGSFEKVPEILEKAYNIFIASNEISYISDYYRYMSLYSLKQNSIIEALKYCDEALLSAEKSCSDMKKLEAISLKGDILVLNGEIEKATDLYSESINLSIQLESDYETAKGYFKRHLAFEKSGKNPEAQGDMQKAREAIKRIGNCKWTSIIEENKLI